EDGIRDFHVTGVQTCALPICDLGSGELLLRSHQLLLHLLRLFHDLLHVRLATRLHRGPPHFGGFTTSLAVARVGTALPGRPGTRSEERRVGEEWGARRQG